MLTCVKINSEVFKCTNKHVQKKTDHEKRDNVATNVQNEDLHRTSIVHQMAVLFFSIYSGNLAEINEKPLCLLVSGCFSLN